MFVFDVCVQRASGLGGWWWGVFWAAGWSGFRGMCASESFHGLKGGFKATFGRLEVQSCVSRVLCMAKSGQRVAGLLHASAFGHVLWCGLSSCWSARVPALVTRFCHSFCSWLWRHRQSHAARLRLLQRCCQSKITSHEMWCCSAWLVLAATRSALPQLCCYRVAQ